MVAQIVDDVVFVLIVSVVMNVLDVLIVMNAMIVRMSQDTDGHLRMFNMIIIMILLMLFINAKPIVKTMTKPVVKQKVSDTKKNKYYFLYHQP